MFLRGAFGCLALKVRQGQHFLMYSFAWAALQGQRNLSHMRPSMCSRPKWPTSSWHPLRATSLSAAGKTNWRRVSPDSLGLACLYRTSFLSSKWLCSCLSWLISGGVHCIGLGLSLVFHLSVWWWLDSWVGLLLGLNASPLGSYRQPACCLEWHPRHAAHNYRPLWDLQALWGQPLVQFSQCCGCDF